MNIRRFVGKDMRDAFREIRASLGPDAVMLSSRKTAGGVEVIAAMDYDDRLISAFREETNQEPGGEEAISETSLLAVEDDEIDPDFSTYEQIAQNIRPTDNRSELSLEDSAAAIAPVDGAMPAQFSSEIKDLRYLLENQLASLAWNDLNRRTPANARALREFSKLGVDTALARELADHLPNSKNPRDTWRVPLQTFAGRLPLASKELTDIGGTFAFVGPTGVGKTTTIAKMAARFVLRHSADELGLVSTDTYRIGAREQLLTFARILGAPMQVAENADELRSVLDRLTDKKLILIDTAGMSHRDLRLSSQFETLRVHGHKVHPILTLSASADRGSLGEVLSVFNEVSPRALTITKLDEATSLGPVLSLAIRSELPVAYIADGQRVPEDLHLAGPRRTWLMQKAAQLARDHGTPLGEDELASEFGQMEMAAHG